MIIASQTLATSCTYQAVSIILRQDNNCVAFAGPIPMLPENTICLILDKGAFDKTCWLMKESYNVDFQTGKRSGFDIICKSN